MPDNLLHNFTRLANAAFLALTLAAIATHEVVAQTPTPTPTPKSAEVIRLEEEKAQAELRKAIAEANKAELDANFPKPSGSPLEGKTTINDGAVIESQMIAYVSLARAANKLVNAIGKNSSLNVSRLAIFNEDDVKLLLSHKASMSQLDILRQSYCELLAKSQTTKEQCKERHAAGTLESTMEFLPAVIPALNIAKSIVGSFVDLTSLFRTNVEIKGQTFDIDEAPFVAEVFRAGRRGDGTGFPPNASFYYPRMYAPDIDPNKKYAILGTLEEVQKLRNTAGRLIAELEKNGEDVKKAEAKIENSIITIQQLNEAVAAATVKISNILKAHCPNMPHAQHGDVYGVESKLKQYCPKITGEQRERFFELVSEIKALNSRLSEADATKIKTEASLEKLSVVRANLWAAFNTNRGGAENVTALAVADAAGQLKSHNEQFDKFVAALVQAASGGGSNALTSLIKAENIKDSLEVPEGSPGKGYWLQVKVVKAGGNNRIKTNLIWDVFTGGNRLSHSGGVIVEYILFDNGGTIVASDTITEYTNYIKSNKVRDLPGKKEKKKAQTSEIDNLN